MIDVNAASKECQDVTRVSHLEESEVRMTPEVPRRETRTASCSNTRVRHYRVRIAVQIPVSLLVRPAEIFTTIKRLLGQKTALCEAMKRVPRRLVSVTDPWLRRLSRHRTTAALYITMREGFTTVTTLTIFHLHHHQGNGRITTFTL